MGKRMKQGGEQNRKRCVKEVCRDAWLLFFSDIKDLWVAALFIAAYLYVSVRFFYTSCPFRAMTGFPCPGCGLTRAGAALIRLHFRQAWDIHPMIYPIVILGVIFFIRRYFLQKNNRVLLKYVIWLGLAMAVFYLYRMAVYFPHKEPMTYYQGAVLHFL